MRRPSSMRARHDRGSPDMWKTVGALQCRSRSMLAEWGKAWPKSARLGSSICRVSEIGTRSVGLPMYVIPNSPLMVTVVGAKPVRWFPSPCCNRACCPDVTVLLILEPGESYRSFDVMPGSTSIARRYPFCCASGLKRPQRRVPANAR